MSSYCFTYLNTMTRKQELISELAYNRFHKLSNSMADEEESFLLLEISAENKSKHLDDMVSSFDLEYQKELAQKFID